MQVYVVTSGEYSDYGIDAIFSTAEKAQEYVSMKNSLMKMNVIALIFGMSINIMKLNM